MKNKNESKENNLIFDIENLWKLNEVPEVNEKVKKISWNDNSTNFFSEFGINGIKRKHTVSITDYKEVINRLFQQYAIELNSEKEYLGKGGINGTLWSLLVENEEFSPVTQKYLRTKLKTDPTTFLKILGVVILFSDRCSRFLKKEKGDLKRDDFANPDLVKMTLLQLDDSVSQFYLTNFFSFVSPFHNEDFRLEISKRKEFSHPIVENHCLYKLRKGTAKNSLNNYRTQIKSFFQWCCQTLTDFEGETINTLNVYNFNNEILEDYKLFLEAEIRRENRTPNGAKQHFVYVKEFFSYLFGMGFITDDFASNIANIKASPYKPRKIPSNEKLQDFFDVVSVYSEDPLKEKAAYLFMLYLGFRLNEVASLEWRDINFGTRTVSIHGKNNESEILPIPDGLLNLMQSLAKRKGKCKYVFSSKTKSFKEKLYLNFKIYKVIAGLDYEEGVHLLRHIYITRLSRICQPNMLRVLARQKSDRSTSFYIHHNDDELIEAINKLYLKEEF